MPEDDECTICFETRPLLAVAACQHGVCCRSCWLQLIKSECPVCRRAFDLETPQVTAMMGSFNAYEQALLCWAREREERILAVYRGVDTNTAAVARDVAVAQGISRMLDQHRALRRQRTVPTYNESGPLGDQLIVSTPRQYGRQFLRQYGRQFLRVSDNPSFASLYPNVSWRHPTFVLYKSAPDSIWLSISTDVETLKQCVEKWMRRPVFDARYFKKWAWETKNKKR